MIYGVFFDSFTAYENGCKKGEKTTKHKKTFNKIKILLTFNNYQGKHSSSDVTDMMLVLRNVLIHLSELIRKKWQTRSIGMNDLKKKTLIFEDKN